MLGNDVVDLLDPDARPDSYSPRFDERVFSAEERRVIAHDANPIARRWAQWGAKEAAYKLAKQIDPGFVFSPVKLVGRYAQISLGARGRISRYGRLDLPRTVGNAIRRIEIRSEETPDRIHVVAAPAGSDWDAIDSHVCALESVDRGPSEAVRSMAIDRLSRNLGIARDRLSIGRRGRIPTVDLDGSRTSLCLSLSHHGRWIAYAMRPRIDLERDASRSWLAGRGEASSAARSRLFSELTP